MYLADSFGYLAYVLLMLFGGLVSLDTGSLDQFKWLAWSVAILGLLAFLLAGWVFTHRKQRLEPSQHIA